jgi:CheY-like chemotaxis protein
MPGSTPVRSNRVLLVDADFRTSQRLAGLLEEDGFVVEVVRDGVSAITRLTKPSPPDILITELQLPLSDGVTIARVARAQKSEMQIIVLTRYPNQPLPPAFGPKPPVVLSKPLDYASLLDVLRGGAPTASDVRAASLGPPRMVQGRTASNGQSDSRSGGLPRWRG